MTALHPTIDDALAMARRLSPRERVRLIALIAQDIAAEPATTAVVRGEPGTAAGLLAFAGAWEGSDLPERIAEVYATRQPVEG